MSAPKVLLLASLAAALSTLFYFRGDLIRYGKMKRM